MASSETGKQALKKACACCQQEFGDEVTRCPNDGAFLAPPPSDPLLGSVIHDTYEVLEVIGEGGMGLVYKARHRFLNRIVAIKVLHKTQITAGSAFKRFQLEAQSVAALSMPNIVTVTDFGTLPDGQPFMVMEYLEGWSLASVIDRAGKIPVERAVKIFIQIANALAAAHNKGVVHRDIKPSNVVLLNLDGYTDFVKIVDFGIAKMLSSAESDSGNLTRTGEIFGTALYMSPEQCRGQRLDERTDIYSLGAVMYRVLSGSTMFADGDMFQLVFKHVMEMPASFKSRGMDIPAQLEAIVFKALAKQPDQRYSSMAELKEALEQFLGANANSIAVPEAQTDNEMSADHTVIAPSSSVTGSRDLAAAIPDESARMTRIAVPTTSAVGLACGLPNVSADREPTIQIVIPKRLIAGVGALLAVVVAVLAVVLIRMIPMGRHDAAVRANPPVYAEPVAAVEEDTVETPQKHRLIHKRSAVSEVRLSEPAPADHTTRAESPKHGLARVKSVFKKLMREIDRH